MFKALQRLSAQISQSQNIMVMDAPTMDAFNDNFPQECLHKDVSHFLGIDYLSVCEKSESQISSKKFYEGVIMGRMRRLLLSIPTRNQSSNQYINVHYLINTGSPFTKLTRRALCALNHIQYTEEYNEQDRLLLTRPYQIGGQLVWVQCSNIDRNSKTYPYHNVNLLGMDFFEQFQEVNLRQNFKKRLLTVELGSNIGGKQIK